MANTNTDLTDEDAADLQFPKDDVSRDRVMSSLSHDNFLENTDSLHCANCYCEVLNQYILCVQCNLNICLACFCNGAEFLNHKSDHDYKILDTKFVLFDQSDWTAEDELRLLDAILNYGNWNLIAQEFPDRSVDEIEDHYEYFYLKKNGHENLPHMTWGDSAVCPPIIVPYRFSLLDSDEPPRYLSNTIGYKSLAGYNPPRSEFENEYNKNAEDILANIEAIDEDDPEYALLTKLQYSLVSSYNRKLKERQRWKNIISRYGLLLLRKTISWLHKYDRTIEKNIYEKMIRFMQFCEPVKFDMLMEGLHRIGELKIHISRLTYLRRKGITTLGEGKLFLKLNDVHEQNRKAIKLFRTNLQINWKHNKSVRLDIAKIARRRVFAPIEIVGMPGYCKLTEKEKDLCRHVRLVPATYLQLRDVLVAEQARTGYVKLQTARRLLKIDVNKTRKLHDFLIENGFITK